MCGLVGMAGGNIVHADKVALKWMMYFDAIRGEDSTGLALVNKEYNIQVTKELGRPDALWYGNDLFDGNGVVKGADTRVFIGHNRAATVGKVSIENAHPFQHGEVVGAHNGTLRGIHRLSNWKDFSTDSEAIMYNFSQEDDVEKVVGKLDGAYALTWWDGYTRTMNFIRNKERPLYFTRRKDKDVIYWASTEWLLSIALSKARISYEKIEEFDENHHYSLNMEFNSPVDFKKVDFVKSEKMEGYVYVPSFRNYGGHHQQNPFQGVWKGSSQTDKEKERKEFQKWEGKEVEFLPGQLKTGLTGSEYLEGIVTDSEGKDVEIRIYNHNIPIFKKLKEGKTYFTCTIKKSVILYVKNKAEYYLLPDNRSIQEVVANNIIPFKNEKKEENHDVYSGFNGRTMNVDQWTEATRNGCCYCCASVEPWDHHKVEWLNNTEFLCPSCKTSEHAIEMASQIYGYR